MRYKDEGKEKEEKGKRGRWWVREGRGEMERERRDGGKEEEEEEGGERVEGLYAGSHSALMTWDGGTERRRKNLEERRGLQNGERRRRRRG